MFAQTSASRSCPKYDPVSEYKKQTNNAMQQNEAMKKSIYTVSWIHIVICRIFCHFLILKNVFKYL